MKRAAFIGRFQPFHNGHAWLIDQKLSQGCPILILVRDTPTDPANPFTTAQVVGMIQEVYHDQDVVVQIIPDIDSVNYGRGVGYGVVEHVPPSDIGRVSATQIREGVRQGDDSWKANVNPRIHRTLESLLR